MSNVVTALIGIICILLGMSHRKGKISTLHSYHRKRVSEEDRLPFGKMVGLGTIIIGVTIILMGAFNFAADWLQNELYATIGCILFVVGFAVGLGISFYAMFKYNKGIF